MIGISDQERSELVSLMGVLSPKEIPVNLPALSEDLVSLVQKPLPRQPRAVIFDIYGTLVVSAAGGEPNQPGAWESERGNPARERLANLLSSSGFLEGVPDFDRKLTQTIINVRQKMLKTTTHPEVDIQVLLGKLLPHLSPAQVRTLSLVHEAWRNPCSLMPGAGELLSKLGETSLAMGIVSNAQFYTPILLESLLGKSLEKWGFDSDLTLYSFESAIAKPDSYLFEVLIKRLAKRGIPSERTLYIGNSGTNDVVPPQKLGMMTALFAGDQRSFRPGEPGLSPDTLLTQWKDLWVLLDL